MMIDIELYVSGRSPDIDRLIEELSQLLQHTYPDQYVLQLVDVLQVPEQALQNDVFATPTLLRRLPEPVIRLLGQLTDTHKVIAAIADWDNQQPDEILVV